MHRANTTHSTARKRPSASVRPPLTPALPSFPHLYGKNPACFLLPSSSLEARSLACRFLLLCERFAGGARSSSILRRSEQRTNNRKRESRTCGREGERECTKQSPLCFGTWFINDCRRRRQRRCRPRLNRPRPVSSVSHSPSSWSSTPPGPRECLLRTSHRRPRYVFTPPPSESWDPNPRSQREPLLYCSVTHSLTRSLHRQQLFMDDGRGRSKWRRERGLAPQDHFELHCGTFPSRKQTTQGRKKEGRRKEQS